VFAYTRPWVITNTWESGKVTREGGVRRRGKEKKKGYIEFFKNNFMFLEMTHSVYPKYIPFLINFLKNYYIVRIFLPGKSTVSTTVPPDSLSHFP
jgi:hypothetical protein